MNRAQQPLVLASSNAGKLEEFRALLAADGFDVRAQAEFGVADADETGLTFVENAILKARHACRATGLPSLADDSGLCVDALDGAPGVHTADWAETGQGRDFGMAMRRTWDELEAKGAPAPRTAQFRCTLVLMWPDGHDEVFEGVLPGRVTWPPRGAEGHGYDPIFVPDGHDITLGEMSAEQKNSLSHRALAVAKLIEGSFA